MSIEWLKKPIDLGLVKQAVLARAAKITPDKLNKILAGTRQLRIEEAERLKHALSLILGAKKSQGQDVLPAARPTNEADFSKAIPLELGARDLPIYGSAKAGFDGAEIDYLNPITHFERPAKLIGVPNACGILVSSDSMEPRYFSGEILFLDPRLPSRAGDFVVVELPDHLAIVKRLVRKTDDYVELEQLNPHERKRLKKVEIVDIYKIVGSWSSGGL